MLRPQTQRGRQLGGPIVLLWPRLELLALSEWPVDHRRHPARRRVNLPIINHAATVKLIVYPLGSLVPQLQGHSQTTEDFIGHKAANPGEMGWPRLEGQPQELLDRGYRTSGNEIMFNGGTGPFPFSPKRDQP